MSRWNLAWLLGLSTAALVGLSLTYSAPSRSTSLQKKHENLRLLVDVLEEVQQRYVRELDPDKMRELVENMINGGLEKLDPHSGFISPDEFKQFKQQNKGKFGGVGIRVKMEERTGLCLVESPLPGTPAYEAGVQAGDIIMKVDGKSTEMQPLRKIVDLIQGEPGTDITLTVLHEGAKKPADLAMKRAEIKVESVLGDQRTKVNLKEWDFWIDPTTKIGYVRVIAFTETTVAELTRVVDAMQKLNMRGLVVDLRNNPGGLLQAAVNVSSMFLAEGKTIVTTKGRGGAVEEVYRSQPPAQMRPGTYYPVAILINRYSASASEIVAAALQDHVRAIIIGERSYGKGSVQNVIRMEAGASALKLTTASYWRPNEENIHRFPDSTEKDKWGVKPNPGYEIKLTDPERLAYYKYRRERDRILPPGQEAPKPPEYEDEEEIEKDGKKIAQKVTKTFRDRVLDKALDYIREEMNKQQPRDARAPQVDVPAATVVRPERVPAFARQDRSTRQVVR